MASAPTTPPGEPDTSPTPVLRIKYSNGRAAPKDRYKQEDSDALIEEVEHLLPVFGRNGIPVLFRLHKTGVHSSLGGNLQELRALRYQSGR